MKKKKILKNKIREKRRSMNITQKQLAEQAGVTRQTILFIEKKFKAPSLITAQKIAKALNCKIEEIFIFED